MTLFMGKHVNRIDKKGRTSVPAPFRSALEAADGAFDGGALVLRPSHKHPMIEVRSRRWLAEQAALLDDQPEFDDDTEDMRLALFGSCHQINVDPEGRIILPADFAAFANISTAIAFVGAGTYVQLWEPGAALAALSRASQTAATRRLSPSRGRASLGLRPATPSDGEGTA